MWHLYMVLLIASDTAAFLGATEPFWRRPRTEYTAVNFICLAATLFVLVWLIQLAQT